MAGNSCFLSPLRRQFFLPRLILSSLNFVSVLSGAGKLNEPVGPDIDFARLFKRHEITSCQTPFLKRGTMHFHGFFFVSRHKSLRYEDFSLADQISIDH